MQNPGEEFEQFRPGPSREELNHMLNPPGAGPRLLYLDAKSTPDHPGGKKLPAICSPALGASAPRSEVNRVYFYIAEYKMFKRNFCCR
jgi:hypothetical protein